MENVCIRCNKSFDEFYIETDEKTLGCHIYRLYSDGYCWCFCLDSLFKWINISEKENYASNPITRKPLDSKIVQDIKNSYISIYGQPKLENDDKEINELMEDIVNMRISMAEKTSGKIPLSLVSSHVISLYRDIAELNGNEWDDTHWKNIEKKVLIELEKQGRYV